MIEGFLLGLSNGPGCLAYCAPMLVPFLLSEGGSGKGRFMILLQFFAGRFVGYMIFGTLAWLTGQLLPPITPRFPLLAGAAYLLVATLLIFYAFTEQRLTHPARIGQVCIASRFAGQPGLLVPLIAGLATGLSLCPPFLAALFEGGTQPQLLHCLLTFIMFFAGSSLFLAPLPLIGILGRNRAIAATGRMAAGVVGSYYLYSATILLFSGG